jgi:HlyD family secretion protein
MDPSKPKKFPFRPGMNASADIKTKRKDGVVAVPITSVAARVKGSDQNLDEKKKETNRDSDENADEETAITDDLEEVVFIVKPDGKVEKKIVTTGIQDINYIEVTTGLTGNEEVVSAPYTAISKTLRPGTKVTVVPKDKLFEK